MKYLILTADGDEIFYDLPDIERIVSDYASNVLDDEDLSGNGIKPLEMVTVLHFLDGRTATFRTARLEMRFG